ncbi:MAG: universal stress protein [Candidatus Thermoplasmatota archaeon]|nr:universal stress protein [Candidatus Thermoplasmatota archaeon]
MDQYKRILIPTDGSEYTKIAVEKGISLAALLGAKVTALYVVDQASFAAIPPDSMITNLYSILNREGEEAVKHVKELGEKAGVQVEMKIAEGVPAEEIVKEAKANDIVVMGTLGRTGISRLLLGNVAEKVVRHAPCPVMLIRLKEE